MDVGDYKYRRAFTDIREPARTNGNSRRSVLGAQINRGWFEEESGQEEQHTQADGNGRGGLKLQSEIEACDKM